VTVVAATYQNEREAAVGTLRRQAFARIYRPRFDEGESSDSPESGDPKSNHG
jgi:hypothetical protein